MGTYCAPLVADLFLFCYERDFIKNSEYDQEIPQSQTAENPVAPRGRAAQPSHSPYLTEVQWDISDLPYAQNKDYQYEVSHINIWRLS